LVSDIPAGDGKNKTFFYSVTQYKQAVSRRKVTCRTRIEVKGGNPVQSPRF
jgi:hypothetical protein